jgi:uncharacterized membrane protein
MARRRDPHPDGRLPRARRVSQALFYLAYPFVIYWSYTRLSTRGTGVVVLALYGVAVAGGVRGLSDDGRELMRRHLPMIVFIAAAALSGERRVLLLQPVVVSLYLLATFTWSLVRGPSMYERFGRLADPHLPDFLTPYCRWVTLVWCAFFATNAGLVIVLSRAAPIGWWALYTGALAYVAIGLLVAGEGCFRRWWFRYYGDGRLDRVFARMFPPEQTARGRRSLAYAAARGADTDQSRSSVFRFTV